MKFSRKIWYLLTQKEKRNFIIILTLMFVGALLETLSIGAVLPAIAIISDPDVMDKYPQLNILFEHFNLNDFNDFVIFAICVLGLIFIFKTIYMGVLLWFQVKFAFNLQTSLSTRLFKLYLSQPYSFFLNNNSSKLITNTTNEIYLFTFQGILPLMIVILETLVLTAVLVLLLRLEPYGTLSIFLVCGSISSIFYYVTRKKITNWGLVRQENDSQRLKYLQQGFGGIKEIKLYHRQESFINLFLFHSKKSANIGHLHNVMQQYPRQWFELIAVISVIILILFMLNQGKVISTIIPIVGVFAMAAFRLMPSVVRILASLQSMRFGLTIIDFLFNEFSLDKNSQKNRTEKKEAIPFNKKIELKKVDFSYSDSSKKILNNFSLTITKGKTIGIKGKSGSGKSTLIDIIIGLLSPQSGSVVFDDKHIISNSNKSLAYLIGYVPQSIFFTDDSIRKNIALGIEDNQIDNKKILRCLKLSQLFEFVDALPEGIDTNIGEGGVRLSGGQRQRIGIARALYNDPQILLFDESTSSLDKETALDVVSSINKLRGKKTIIVVSHQTELMSGCDEIYHMTNGRVILEPLKKNDES